MRISDWISDVCSSDLLAGTAAKKLPPEIEFSALSGIPLVLPSILNGLRTTVESVARRMRFSLDVLVDADSIHAHSAVAFRQALPAALSKRLRRSSTCSEIGRAHV